jgi:hypothetical protein
MAEEADNSIKMKSLEILLNKYKSENEFLKSQIEHLKKYKNHVIGYILILSSAIIFLLSMFFIGNLQFVFLGFSAIALISLAIYLIFIYSPNTYPLKAFSSALKFAINNLAQVLTYFQLEKMVIFLPIKDTVYQFIPFTSESNSKELPASNELSDDTFEIQNKGIIFHPIGFSIVELVKNEFSMNLYKIDQNKLETLLQEILIDQLNLVRALSFTKLSKGRYKLIFTEDPLNFNYLAKNNVKIDPQIGCPICSFVAILLAWSTSRSILLKTVDFNPIENASTIFYELGELYH